MSQWTHIRGGFELISTPYEKKKLKNELYLPYPEEQFKLSMPTLGYTTDFKAKKDKGGHYKLTPYLEIDKAYIFSLPRAKKYIEKAFKSFLPQGEISIRYSIDQNINDYKCSCSGFSQPCLFKYYKDAINRLYETKDEFQQWNYNSLKKHCNLKKECSTENVNHILVAIRDDIRFCSGIELLDGLEQFFNYLEENDIQVEDGYLEWQDEYEPDVIYAWRNSRLSFTHHQFLKLDQKTNKILWSKTYKYKKKENGMRDDGWDIVEESFEETKEEK